MKHLMLSYMKYMIILFCHMKYLMLSYKKYMIILFCNTTRKNLDITSTKPFLETIWTVWILRVPRNLSWFGKPV
jgi:hypothetical protein